MEAGPRSDAQGDVVPIGDYAVIGDGRTTALVSRRGSIDWLCLPRFDSAACFSRLLGDPDGSHWSITVPGDDVVVERRYVEDTNVLRTTYRTRDAEVRVTDAMPTGDGRADLVRRIEGIRGRATVRQELVIRFDYGRIRPWVHRDRTADGDPLIIAIAGPDKLALSGPRLPRAVDGRHEGEFDVAE